MAEKQGRYHAKCDLWRSHGIDTEKKTFDDLEAAKAWCVEKIHHSVAPHVVVVLMDSETGWSLSF